MSLALLRRDIARNGKTITLQNRAILPPAYGTVNFGENFNGDSDVQALVCTQRGKTLFDGVATETPITHRFILEYVSGVTAETWVEYNGRRFDVLDVENDGEKDACLVLSCIERGTGEASKA